MARRRLELDPLPTPELVARGIAAARVGETDEARLLLEEAARREPEEAETWLWLAGVRQEPRAKRQAFERVLELRPDDPDARAGLERLAEKFGAGVLSAEDDGLQLLACTWHPERETLLRCNRCGRPMCPACSRQHPVGLRCKACAKETRSPLYRVGPREVIGAAALGTTAAFLSSVLAWLALALVGGFFVLIGAFFLGRALGIVIAEGASRGSGRKRGREMQITAALSVVLGIFATFMVIGIAARWNIIAIPRASTPGLLVYCGVAIHTVVTRLR